MYELAKFLTNFADAGQVAVAESSDQGLQCLPIYYTYLLLLECPLTPAVPNLLNICLLAEFLTNFADSGQVAVAESYDQGHQYLPNHYTNLLHFGLPPKTCCTKLA